jgi:hypothetical protein
MEANKFRLRRRRPTTPSTPANYHDRKEKWIWFVGHSSWSPRCTATWGELNKTAPAEVTRASEEILIHATMRWWFYFNGRLFFPLRVKYLAYQLFYLNLIMYMFVLVCMHYLENRVIKIGSYINATWSLTRESATKLCAKFKRRFKSKPTADAWDNLSKSYLVRAMQIDCIRP